LGDAFTSLDIACKPVFRGTLVQLGNQVGFLRCSQAGFGAWRLVMLQRFNAARTCTGDNLADGTTVS
jgi:hypothetical protein